MTNLPIQDSKHVSPNYCECLTQNGNRCRSKAKYRFIYHRDVMYSCGIKLHISKTLSNNEDEIFITEIINKKGEWSINNIEHHQPNKLRSEDKTVNEKPTPTPIVNEPNGCSNDSPSFEMIGAFTQRDTKRSENDENNKKRENIIEWIINKKVPNDYYISSSEWLHHKTEIELFIKKLCKLRGIDQCYDISCEKKAGRSNNYDFKITINKTEIFKVEFKFNAKHIKNSPQFVSPGKPSNFLDSSYEEYWYTNFLVHILDRFNLQKPEKNIYVKEINATSPKCVQALRDKYKRGLNFKTNPYSGGNVNDLDFYETMCTCSKESIRNFIEEHGIKKELLTQYLLKTQQDKYYMLYKDGSYHLETVNMNDYDITEIIKESKYSRYIGKTKSGKSLKILLRWKNCLGVAYPAFQIK